MARKFYLLKYQKFFSASFFIFETLKILSWNISRFLKLWLESSIFQNIKKTFFFFLRKYKIFFRTAFLGKNITIVFRDKFKTRRESFFSPRYKKVPFPKIKEKIKKKKKTFQKIYQGKLRARARKCTR